MVGRSALDLQLLPAAWLANQRRQQQPPDRAADPIDAPVVAAAA